MSATFLGIMGILTVLIVISLLFTRKVSVYPAFIIPPIVIALICGFGVSEIVDFIKKGVSSNTNNALMLIFAILFFGVMNDSGVFDVIVGKIIKKAGKGVTSILILTVIITLIGHLDGSGATTFLIAIVPLLPLYKKLGMRPVTMMMLICGTAGVMNLVPWGGPSSLIASTLEVDVNLFWRNMLPMEIVGVLAMIGIAVYMAPKEKAYILANGGAVAAVDADAVGQPAPESANAKCGPVVFWINIALILAAIALLIFSDITAYVIWVVFFMVALLINVHNPKEQVKTIKKHAGEALFVGGTMICAGFLTGILNNSGMSKAMVEIVLNLIPAALTAHMHWILGIFEPFLCLIGFTYATQAASLYPVVAALVEPAGVTAIQAATALLVPFITVVFITPLNAALYLGCGLSGVEQPDVMKFSFKYMVVVSWIMLLAGVILGCFPI